MFVFDCLDSNLNPFHSIVLSHVKQKMTVLKWEEDLRRFNKVVNALD